MDIQGINGYSSRVQNHYMPSIPGIGLEEAGRQDETAGVPAAGRQRVHEEASAEVSRKEALLEDLSITFNRQEDFGYLGKDSDIHSLDMEQAISDMKKDQVLQQYQYFVGSSRNLFIESEDGMVVPKF